MMLFIDEKVPHREAILDGIDLLENAKLAWFRRGYLDGATDVALGNIVVEKREDGLFLKDGVEDALQEMISASARLAER